MPFTVPVLPGPRARGPTLARMNANNRLKWVLFAAAFCAAGTASADPDKNESGKRNWERRAEKYDKDGGKHQDREDRRAERWRDRDHDDRAAYVGTVPKGHMPPPGECRLWYPDRPAGHQPPPTKCENLGVDYGERRMF